MKKIILWLSILWIGVSNGALFAETEPNDTCLTGNLIYALDKAVSYVKTTVDGSTISKGYEEGTNKPDYDRDNFYFTAGSDGKVRVKFQSTGFTNFFIGVPTCNWNVKSAFTSFEDVVFYVKKGERVNILAMCRHPRNYQMVIEFTPLGEIKADSKISVKDVSVSEGDEGISKEMVFTLVLDKPSSDIVGVDFKTKPINAQAGKDFESKDTRVVFMPGEVEKDVKVVVLGDNEKEEDEIFEVVLSNPYNAVIERNEAVGRILDDDTGFITSAYFDKEPNNECSMSEVIEELDGVSKEVKFKAKGQLNPFEEDSDEARDYFHFTPDSDGNLTIELTANRAVWFTIGDRGCASVWADSDTWNIQRGTSIGVFKTFEIKKGKRVDIAAVSYDPKSYDMKIIFTPQSEIKKNQEAYENTLEGFVKRMYVIVLKREAEKDGYDFWVNALRNGEKSAQDMTRYFFDSKEFKGLNLSNEEFLNRLYESVMNRKPDREGYNYWLSRLESGDLSRVKIVDMFVDSPEFKDLAEKYGVRPN